MNSPPRRLQRKSESIEPWTPPRSANWHGVTPACCKTPGSVASTKRGRRTQLFLSAVDLFAPQPSLNGAFRRVTVRRRMLVPVAPFRSGRPVRAREFRNPRHARTSHPPRNRAISATSAIFSMFRRGEIANRGRSGTGDGGGKLKGTRSREITLKPAIRVVLTRLIQRLQD